MSAILFLPILIIVILCVIILPVVLICVLLATKNRRPAVPGVPSLPTPDPEMRNRQREMILERLAAREISREEAEAQLLDLDRPLPEQLPMPPRKQVNGCFVGCLAALIVGILVFLFLILMVFDIHFMRIRRAEARQQAYQIEKIHQVEEINR